ncbi:ABC transporter related protein [Terriglobus saanensis SP1PR4]|uniref:ABC transporter related protein n=1 Tax=Terriglobus saanensis (strain ATCC BAA-1853 / DSM 23119 / SP1PR4) TaxID=401053 RepID=E8V7U0_TERSS|nr:ABC transporter related protein [Terriglobus saanensis SP1PR4]
MLYPENVSLNVEPFLDFRNVNIARGTTTVLHDIHLQIARGEHIAILGPNGCGKSTLIKAMTCEIYPLVQPELYVRLFGRERWDLTELRKRLGVVAPELPGKPTRTTTGMDAVLSGFFSSSTLWPNLTVTDEMRSRAIEVLHLLDAESLKDKFVGEMSAGQQRRIMIGRALVGADTDAAGNRMLLLDEPSNALDLAAQRELRNTMRRLAQQGTGLILITHHIADIIPEIDRVVMMREGRIVADGSKQTLLTKENLRMLFGIDVDLHEREGFFHAW